MRQSNTIYTTRSVPGIVCCNWPRLGRGCDIDAIAPWNYWNGMEWNDETTMGTVH